MSFVYFCTKCNNLELQEEISGQYRCSSCGEMLLPLKKTADEWNNCSESDMMSIIENAKNPVGLKKPSFLNTPVTDNNADNSNMMNCPDCGSRISKRATSCPNCGCPIASEKNKGKIRLKLGMYGGVGGTQDVSIKSGENTIWTGSSGQIAEFEVTEPTEIEVTYEMNLMHYGGTVTGLIDPEKGNKYAVSIRAGVFKTVLTFQIVDFIDSE